MEKKETPKTHPSNQSNDDLVASNGSTSLSSTSSPRRRLYEPYDPSQPQPNYPPSYPTFPTQQRLHLQQQQHPYQHQYPQQHPASYSPLHSRVMNDRMVNPQMNRRSYPSTSYSPSGSATAYNYSPIYPFASINGNYSVRNHGGVPLLSSGRQYPQSYGDRNLENGQSTFGNAKVAGAEDVSDKEDDEDEDGAVDLAADSKSYEGSNSDSNACDEVANGSCNGARIEDRINEQKPSADLPEDPSNPMSAREGGEVVGEEIFLPPVHVYASLLLNDIHSFDGGVSPNNACNDAAANSNVAEESIWFSALAEPFVTWAQLTKRMVEGDVRKGSERWILPLSNVSKGSNESQKLGMNADQTTSEIVKSVEKNDNKTQGRFLCYGNGFATYLLPLEHDLYHSEQQSRQIQRIKEKLPLADGLQSATTNGSSTDALKGGIFVHLCAPSGPLHLHPPHPEELVLETLNCYPEYKNVPIVEWRVRLMDLGAHPDLGAVVELNLDVNDESGSLDEDNAAGRGATAIDANVVASGADPNREEKNKVQVLLYTTKKDCPIFIDSYCIVPWKSLVKSLTAEFSDAAAAAAGTSRGDDVVMQQYYPQYYHPDQQQGEKRKRDVTSNVEDEGAKHRNQVLTKGMTAEINAGTPTKAKTTKKDAHPTTSSEPPKRKRRGRKSKAILAAEKLAEMASGDHHADANLHERAAGEANGKEVFEGQHNSGSGKKESKKSATKAKKPKKDPNAPKRNIGAYAWFMRSNWKLVQKENPGMAAQDVTKIVARQFKEMDAVESAKYQQMADVDKERYSKEMTEYKINNPSIPDEVGSIAPPSVADSGGCDTVGGVGEPGDAVDSGDPCAGSVDASANDLGHVGGTSFGDALSGVSIICAAADAMDTAAGGTNDKKSDSKLDYTKVEGMTTEVDVEEKTFAEDEATDDETAAEEAEVKHEEEKPSKEKGVKPTGQSEAHENEITEKSLSPDSTNSGLHSSESSPTKDSSGKEIQKIGQSNANQRSPTRKSTRVRKPKVFGSPIKHDLLKK